MKKRYRYSIFITSAILACAPLAMNKANGTNQIVKASNLDTTTVPGKANELGNANNPTKPTESNKLNNPGKTNEPVKANDSSNSNEPNKTNKPDEVNNPTNSNKPNKTNTSSNSSEPNKPSDPSKTVYDGHDYAHAYQMTANYDKDMHTNIQLTEGLTESDVNYYFQKHTHILINNKEDKKIKSKEEFKYSKDQLHQLSNEAGYKVTHHPDIGSVGDDRDKNGNKIGIIRKGAQDYNVSMLLEDGDKLSYQPTATGINNLLPNKWYSWHLNDHGIITGDPVAYATRELGTLPTEITDRVHYDKNSNTIALKTDEHAEFPLISSKSDVDGVRIAFNFGTDQFGPVAIFTISKDPKALSLPPSSGIIRKTRDYINGAPVVPENDHNSSKNNTSTNNDQNTTVDDSTVQDFSNTPVDTGDDFNFTPATTTDVQNSVQEVEQTLKETTPNVNNSSNVDDSKVAKEKAKKIADIDGLVFVHNAFIYDKNGKVVKNKYGVYQLKRRDQKAKILDGGRLYHGKFYRIGKNKYIKASNVGRVTNKRKSIKVNGTINASRKYGVKLYNSKGKFIKKVVRSAKKVSFDQEKYMHGRTFYRIKGTNTWIRLSNIKFIKSVKK